MANVFVMYYLVKTSPGNPTMIDIAMTMKNKRVDTFG